MAPSSTSPSSFPAVLQSFLKFMPNCKDVFANGIQNSESSTRDTGTIHPSQTAVALGWAWSAEGATGWPPRPLTINPTESRYISRSRGRYGGEMLRSMDRLYRRKCPIAASNGLKRRWCARASTMIWPPTERAMPLVTYTYAPGRAQDNRRSAPSALKVGNKGRLQCIGVRFASSSSLGEAHLADLSKCCDCYKHGCCWWLVRIIGRVLLPPSSWPPSTATTHGP
jgi:hypothetical protein